MSTRALFICDPLAGFKTYKDSTFDMMRECQRRGIEVHTAEITELQATAQNGQSSLSVFAHHIRIEDSQAAVWWMEEDAKWRQTQDFDVVVMRKDPPFDQAYFVATQLLEIAEREGVRVINSPQALRHHGEKMSALEFPQFTPETLVTNDLASLKGFAARLEKIVIKPLDAMGGAGVFVLAAHDPNLPSALEVLTENGVRPIVAQRYLPEIAKGDKRILVIDGEPVGMALARIPAQGQSRGNLAAGGTGVVAPLSARDLDIARTVGAALAPRGLMLLGLDVIGDCLTEINVTSPTGFQEITAQSGVGVASLFIDAIFRQ